MCFCVDRVSPLTTGVCPLPPFTRSEGGDHSLWANEEEVQSVQRDQKTSQPPDVSMHCRLRTLPCV